MLKALMLTTLCCLGTAFADDAGLTAAKSITPPKVERDLPGKVVKPKAQEKAPARKAVMFVDADRQVIWINLGPMDGVKPRAKLQVGQQDDEEIVKGQIEVTRVLGPQISEARILSEDVKDPIGKGDLVIP